LGIIFRVTSVGGNIDDAYDIAPEPIHCDIVAVHVAVYEVVKRCATYNK
jgi:hypothetical protein